MSLRRRKTAFDEKFWRLQERKKQALLRLEICRMVDINCGGEEFGRLYVSTESGVISIFDERGRKLERVGEGFFALKAHSVAVDSRTHRVYFPLQNVGGKPILRIALPSDKQL